MDFLELCVTTRLFRGKKKILRPPKRCKSDITIIFTTLPRLVNVSTREWWIYGLTIFFHHLQCHVGSRHTSWRVERPKKEEVIYHFYISFYELFFKLLGDRAFAVFLLTL